MMDKFLPDRVKPFILIFSTIIFTYIFSLIPADFDLGFYKVKEMDLFIDVKPDSLISYTGGQNSPAFASVIDLASFVDAFSAASPAFPEGGSAITGNVDQMKFFIEAVKASKSKKVRVAHFGDSAIEGDMITADFRKIMQAKFGGNGVGMLAINSQDIAFRLTTTHSFSPNWTFGSLFGSNSEKLNLGINGTAARTTQPAWVKYEASTRYGFKQFTNARIFYSSDKAVNVNYSFNDEGAKSVSLKASSNVEDQTVTYSGRAKSVKFDFPASGGTVLYGVSLEDGNGIYIDNFPLRGNSGIGMRDIDENTLKQFNQLLEYKLIILQFGLNIVNAGGEMRDFSWYENSMVKVINTLKSAFPNTSILLVGVQDKGLKKGSKFTTDPKVLKLIEAQKKIVQQTGIAFWSLFDAMGGQESMSRWVADGLATKDYTHLTTEGAAKVARDLSDVLIDLAK